MSNLSDDELREQLKEIVVKHAHATIGRRDEIQQMGVTARGIWQALLQQPTWTLLESPKPEGFVEPNENWSEPPTVTQGGASDDAVG